MLVDGQQFHRIHAEPGKVRDLFDKPEVGPWGAGAGRWVRREPLDVHLVYNKLFQLEVGRANALPVEGVVDDNPLRHDGRVVARVGKQVARAGPGIVGEQQVVDVAELPADRPGVRIQQQL
jgi:hypothetical protein